MANNSDNDTDYDNFTLEQLREHLKQLNAPSSGRKKALVERLLALDAMGRIKATETLTPEYCMVLPPIAAYNDVNEDSQVPELSMQSIQRYYDCQEKSFEKKYEVMYRERWAYKCNFVFSCSNAIFFEL
mgnify:CR=1 FL=1